VDEEAGMIIWYLACFILQIVFGAICGGIAGRKGYSSGLGFTTGFFFALLGLIIWLVIPSKVQAQAPQQLYAPPPQQYVPPQQYQQPPQQYAPPQPVQPQYVAPVQPQYVAPVQPRYAAAEPQAVEVVKIRCLNCKSIEDPDAKFCSNCGHAI
jgi:hypothetical protein